MIRQQTAMQDSLNQLVIMITKEATSTSKITRE